MAKNEAQEVDTAEAGDAPLLDLNDASIKKMIARAKKRGVVTYEELNEALPQDQMSSEQIEDVMSALNDMGINVVESAEDSDTSLTTSWVPLLTPPLVTTTSARTSWSLSASVNASGSSELAGTR